MFKTLIVVVEGAPCSPEMVVAVLPVSCQLSLKLIAAAAGAKKATMCDPAAAERSSGYVVGGISPFGQRRQLRTVVDESALLFDTIYVSGGKRGLDIGLAQGDLIGVLHAIVAPVTARGRVKRGRRPAVWGERSAGGVALQGFDSSDACSCRRM